MVVAVAVVVMRAVARAVMVMGGGGVKILCFLPL